MSPTTESSTRLPNTFSNKSLTLLPYRFRADSSLDQNNVGEDQVTATLALEPSKRVPENPTLLGTFKCSIQGVLIKRKPGQTSPFL